MDDNLELSGQELQEETRPPEFPFYPINLIALFFQPRRFFSKHLALGQMPNHLLMIWCAGIASVLGRFEANLVRSELGRPRPGWDQLEPVLVNSWMTLWGYLLTAGILSGMLIWYVGGWWYRVRLRWAGAVGLGARRARLLYIYTSFVQTGPTLLLLIVKTLVFKNYAEMWEAEELWSMGILVFPFWACLASYSGAREMFSVKKGLGLLWLVVLPWLVYVFSFGLITLLFAMAG